MSNEVNDDSAAPVQQPAAQHTKRIPKTPRRRRTDAELVREILYYREKTAQLQAEMEWEQSPEGRATLEAKALRAAEYDAGLHEHIRRIGVALAELIALIHEGDAAAEAEFAAKMAPYDEALAKATAEAAEARALEAAVRAAYEHSANAEDDE